MIDEHTVDYHPSRSILTSRIHPLIFLWIPKEFISPNYFLNFSQTCISQLVVEKRPLDKGRRGRGAGGHEIVFCQGCFSGNSLLFLSLRHQKP